MERSCVVYLIWVGILRNSTFTGIWCIERAQSKQQKDEEDFPASAFPNKSKKTRIHILSGNKIEKGKAIADEICFLY